MLLKKTLVSALAGAAMLALPAIALAGPQNHDYRGHPAAWHDNGRHNGWFKHDRDYREDNHFKDPYCPPVVRTVPRHTYWQPVPYRPAPRPIYYAEPVRPYYPAPAPIETGWNGYNYGPPLSYYDAIPPTNYNASQQVSWLMQRRQQAYVVLAKMRARHDRNAANRMLGVINNLNARIGNLNHRTAYYNTPAANYAPQYAANPAAYNSYAGGYNPAYSNSPVMGALSGVVGPLLGLPY
jgi:hypothetical protein